MPACTGELCDRGSGSVQDAEGQGVRDFGKGHFADGCNSRRILGYCRKNIAKYSMPYEIEFREEFPKTRVGKIAYTVLEAEEADRLRLKAE